MVSSVIRFWFLLPIKLFRLVLTALKPVAALIFVLWVLNHVGLFPLVAVLIGTSILVTYFTRKGVL